MTTARRTQAERASETRSKLLEATVECLADLGYSGTSTTAVCQRAGVSRGAQLHHFPTRADLVGAAIEYVYECRVEEIRLLLADVPEGPDRLATAIDLLWGIFQGTTFAAWLELAVASRTDPLIAERVGRASKYLSDRVNEEFKEFFPELSQRPVVGPYGPLILFIVLDGLAMAQISGFGAEHDIPVVFETVKQVARVLFELTAPPER